MGDLKRAGGVTVGSDEIDIRHLIVFAWVNKWVMLLSILAGISIALAAFFLSSEKEQWTASVYISKSSLYTLYEEINASVQPPSDRQDSQRQAGSEESLYVFIRDDIFNSALGLMIAKNINVRTSYLKAADGNDVYIASITAATEVSAKLMLDKLMMAASLEAVSVNLPAISGSEKMRAFNYLGPVELVVRYRFKQYFFIGALLGIFMGGLILFFKYFLQEEEVLVQL